LTLPAEISWKGRMHRIYLDYAATTPVHPNVVKAMLPYFSEAFGNPSSIYRYGQEARETVESSRAEVASLIAAQPEEIVFTSGGTEADNLSIEGVALANADKGRHIITSAIEHHAVLETCLSLKNTGFIITVLPVDETGMVSPDDVRQAIKDDTILISVMHANNEIGTIQPIAEIGRIAREADVYFHTDAVQTAGHIPINVDEMGIDLLSISAHKLYGPKGVGALYIREGTKINPIIHGGEQERKMRASTENVPGIAGFGQAVKIARGEMDKETKQISFLRDKLIRGIKEKIADVRLNGHPENRLPNNVNMSIDYVEGEAMCLSLDLEGICAATGSACNSSSGEPSHVLLAIGLPHQQAYGSLRFTLGKWTIEEDIDQVLEVLPRIVGKLRAMSPFFQNKN